jgi:hypothetical protein
MTPLSVRQLEAKRKAVFVPSLQNIVQELERELDERLEKPPKTEKLREDYIKDEIRSAVMSDCRAVVARYEAHEPEWFTHDQHYQVRAVPSAFDCCASSCHARPQ